MGRDRRTAAARGPAGEHDLARHARPARARDRRRPVAVACRRRRSRLCAAGDAAAGGGAGARIEDRRRARHAAAPGGARVRIVVRTAARRSRRSFARWSRPISPRFEPEYRCTRRCPLLGDATGDQFMPVRRSTLIRPLVIIAAVVGIVALRDRAAAADAVAGSRHHRSRRRRRARRSNRAAARISSCTWPPTCAWSGSSGSRWPTSRSAPSSAPPRCRDPTAARTRSRCTCFRKTCAAPGRDRGRSICVPTRP